MKIPCLGRLLLAPLLQGRCNLRREHEWRQMIRSESRKEESSWQSVGTAVMNTKGRVVARYDLLLALRTYAISSPGNGLNHFRKNVSQVYGTATVHTAMTGYTVSQRTSSQYQLHARSVAPSRRTLLAFLFQKYHEVINRSYVKAL